MDPEDWKVGDVVRCVKNKDYEHVLEFGKEYTIKYLGGLGNIQTKETGDFMPIRDRFEFVRRPSEETCPGCGAGLYNTCKDDCPDFQARHPGENPVSFSLKQMKKIAKSATREKLVEVEPLVIEQKPVCACCTADINSGEKNASRAEVIHHDDPCVYAASERWMKPAEKAMFRAQMERRLAKEKEALARSAAISNMNHCEQRMSAGIADQRHRRLYWELVGCKK